MMEALIRTNLWTVFFFVVMPTSFLAYQAQGLTCNQTGWFGDRCQHRCRCTENNCDFTTGECTLGAACDRGWFGFACQYHDMTSSLAKYADLKLEWLYDGDDTTCNDGSAAFVTLRVPITLRLTWLRLYVKDPGHLYTLDVQLRNNFTGSVVNCNNKQTAAASRHVIDIHCDCNFFNEVIVSGQGVSSLCSVYLSAGRNVALKQPITHSSDNPGNTTSDSFKIVDGNVETCHDQNRAVNDEWNLTFQLLQNINSIHTLTSNSTGMKDFNVTPYTEDGTPVDNYEELSKNAPGIFIPPCATSVSRVTISSLGSYALCEVVALGDTVCPVGRYGRECEYSCDNCKNQNCFVSTGGCPDGCIDAFTGGTCQTPCPATNSEDQLFNKVNGTCDDECPPGKMGNLCDQECPDSSYGLYCHKTCNTNCVDQLCDPVSGDCHLCPPGKTGSTCDEECESETYGQDCQKRCSEHCHRSKLLQISSCDSVNGACFFGCVEGYVEPLCLDSSDFGVGIWIGIGVGICGLVAVVVAAVGGYCYRKRLHNTRSGRQRPPGYDGTDFAMQDDHDYRELFRGNDDYHLPTDEESHEISSRRRTANAQDDTDLYGYAVIKTITDSTESDTDGYITPVHHPYYIDIIG